MLEKPKGMPNKVWKQVQNLKNEDYLERWQAAVTLGEIKHESAVPHLIQALKDKNIGVRKRAAEALGEIKHESAVPFLIRALKDENINMRKYAADALFKIAKLLKEKSSKELTPEGKKLLKALALIKPYFMPDENIEVKNPALQSALAGKINEKNARLYIKELRAHKGHLK